MPLSLPPFLRRHGLTVLLGALLAGSFTAYAVCAQRYIGAVDWYGYYQEGLLFKAGRTTLPVELPAAEFPSIVPLGFSVNAQGAVVAQYPPGFPVLLALGGFLGLECYVAPLIGAASVLLLFLLIVDLTGDRATALLYAALWACFPIVVFGSTNMMSDLVAAFCVFSSYFCYRRGWIAGSALLLAFAIGVRPTNVLYLALFSVLLLRDGRLIRYGLYMLPLCAAYGLFNHLHYGAPWHAGYGSVSGALSPRAFVPFLEFFVRQTYAQVGLPVLLLCAWGFRHPWGEKLFLLTWFAVFLVFYSFYVSGGTDAWWWTRYLLPGFGPLFLLSAAGFSRVRRLLGEKLAAGPGRRTVQIALFALVGLMPVYYVWFGLHERNLWTTSKGYVYYQVVQETAATVPAGSYVGSVEFAGSFRLYSKLGSFLSVHDNSPKLLDRVLAQGREAYLIVEPWNSSNAVLTGLLRKYSAEKVRVLDVWGGLPLYRLHARPAS